MKKCRLLTAAIAAMSAITAISASAYAADKVDFEDGNYSFVSIITTDGDDSLLSVENYNGSKQLKIDVQDCTKVPKVHFDVNSMLSDSKFDSVKTIEMDVTIASKDGSSPVGMASGALGTQGSSKSPAYEQTTWELTDTDKAVAGPQTVQRVFVSQSDMLVNGTSETMMLLMRWPCSTDYNMYVDNIRFLDKDGKAIEVSISSQAEPEPADEAIDVSEDTVEEVIPETTEDIVITETVEELKDDSPDSDNDTTSSTTGNLSALAAASALVLSFYAVSMTRKKALATTSVKQLIK